VVTFAAVRANIPRAWRVPALLAVALLACAAQDAPPPSAPESALTECTEPRHPMCTREYRPVCGHRCPAPPCAEDERRTFGNACTACADPEVSAYARGSCETGVDTPAVPLR
jgi:hypothetical protein